VIAPKSLAHHWPDIMQAQVKQVWSVSHAGSPPWLIAENLLVEIDGTQYVKLVGWSVGFVKVVCYDIEKVPRKFSLSGSLGLCNLVESRNVAGDSKASEIKNIFGKLKAKKFISHAAMADSRENPRVVEFTVPAFEGSPATVVKALRADHPTDNLCVELDASTMQAIFGYIRAKGLEHIDTRSYASGAKDDEDGPIYKMGKGRVARKLKRIDEDRLDEGRAPPRFKYLKGQEKE
jgi:hypothetical protein